MGPVLLFVCLACVLFAATLWDKGVRPALSEISKAKIFFKTLHEDGKSIFLWNAGSVAYFDTVTTIKKEVNVKNNKFLCIHKFKF